MPDRTANDISQDAGDADANRPEESKPVPKAVVNRLSLYLRELGRLERGGEKTISSSQLGKLLGFTDAQVRKDLAYFGQFGHPGVGYRCDELVAAIRRILGTDREWVVAIVGVGNRGITLGLIATASEAAQEIADRMTTAGVVGILNFAPVTLSLPPGVSLVGVDLATELEQLSFSVANSQRAADAAEKPEAPLTAEPD